MKVDFLHNPFFPIFAFGFETKKSQFQDIKEKKRYVLLHLDLVRQARFIEALCFVLQEET